MAEPNIGRTRAAAPGALRAVRVILYVQGGATLLGLAGIGLEAASRIEHGQDVPGIVFVLGVVSFGMAVLALVCAPSIVARGVYWVRPSVVLLEAVALVYGVINLLSGAVAGVGEIVIGIVVIVLLARPDVRDWIRG